MKVDAKVVAGLNEYLSYELTGHRQYLIHAAMCRHWGFERLATVQDAYSAEETRHAARIIARILMLDGIAAPRELGPIAGAEHGRDFVSRDLLREMLDDEERHLHWLDIETALIDQVGLQNYLQTQTG